MISVYLLLDYVMKDRCLLTAYAKMEKLLR